MTDPSLGPWDLIPLEARMIVCVFLVFYCPVYEQALQPTASLHHPRRPTKRRKKFQKSDRKHKTKPGL